MQNNNGNPNELDLAGGRLANQLGGRGGNIDNDLAQIALDDDDDEVEVVQVGEGSTLDGGVAVNADEDPKKAKKHSSECDLVLYIYCTEPLDIAPDHSIIKPGISVKIGLDKPTKLKAVFKQYIDFCNKSSDADQNIPKIDLKDVEFSFCQLLDDKDTAETSALMKGDRIMVRKVRADERAEEKERNRAQRDADKTYFHDMKQLLHDSKKPKFADVVLVCEGTHVDKFGLIQRVFSKEVLAHSCVVGKRCKWLMDIIRQARMKAKQQADAQQKGVQCETPEEPISLAAEIEDDGEVQESNEVAAQAPDLRAMNEHEPIDLVDDSSDEENVNVIDVDDDEVEEDVEVVSSSSQRFERRTTDRNLLTVRLPNYSHEAVKILLEYCYTNRVVSLGRDAFVHSCRTRPTKSNGPVPPFVSIHSCFSKRWPNNGLPDIHFSVAIEALSLSEEAGMHRLSLMCEISASQLVSSANVLEALTMSNRQKELSGNDLPRLRKAAMDVILRRGRRGAAEIGRSNFFNKALKEEQSIIIPTLFQGTLEAVSLYAKCRKRDASDIPRRMYRDLDRDDSREREKERKLRRKERAKESFSTNRRLRFEDNLIDLEDSDDDDCDLFHSWTQRRSLQSLSAHNADALTRCSSSYGSLNVPKINGRHTRSKTVKQKLDILRSRK